MIQPSGWKELKEELNILKKPSGDKEKKKTTNLQKTVFEQN